MKIKTGDQVTVIAGKDRGRSSKVLRVWPRTGRLLVEGVNQAKKRQRPRREREKGQTISLAMPLAVSNVQFFCSQCKRGVRLGARLEGKTKTRICRRCRQAV